ncbi:DUF427 domain-containing protein [Kitasatospora sp. MAP5-34]|uniref:DUF427 domain-containing protein n=1 Tax=Kitasatospora sp. MAP5-34 TaxID=3035102 RepID=UPI0024755EB0|nr:DUF427 domain-containing protein [Kitasatospora sp. MAP5-34]
MRIEQGAKRVRAYLGGQAVADTLRPVLVWENPYYPAYYVPVTDVRTDLLTDYGRTKHWPSRGNAHLFDVTVGDRTAVDAAWRFEESPVEELRGLVRLDWDAMDAWFEEDEEVYTHPRSPYTRIDILASSRTVRVELDGVVLAESHSPRLLFETGLPVRYYLPKTDVRLDLLDAGGRVTHCPYKGSAEHLSARVGGETRPEIAWSYRTPLPESQKITGLVAFYNEKVDLYVDGVLQDRPHTKFG